MKPTLNPHGRKQSDFVFIDRWHVKPQEIRPGDVVALTSPNNRNISFIKRVIGVEGDFLNTPRYRLNSVMVPRGHCWVEGDNYRSSLDSNKFGPISMGLIKGKATYIIWPPSRWSKLDAIIPDEIPTERLLNAKTYKRPQIIAREVPKTLDLTIEIDTFDTTGVDSGIDVEEVTGSAESLVYNVEMLLSDKPLNGSSVEELEEIS